MIKLEDLRPTEKQLVIEVVEAAGISTADWKTKTDPSKRSNWSFGGNKQPAILFIWHNHLQVNEKGWIYYQDNSKTWAIKKEREHGPGPKLQARRAHEFHSLINRAYFANQPVRVAILDGKRSDKNIDEATARELDNSYWYVHHLNEVTSEILLVRGVPRPKKPSQSEEVVTTYTQPEIIEPIQAVASSDPLESKGFPYRHYIGATTAYDRDSEVCRQVKTRANGQCEYCGEHGFETARGGSYLEAHHVIPLSCEGTDEVWNVVAICPNDHKRAHFGKDRVQLRDKLITFLANRYVDSRSHLIAMVCQSACNTFH